MSLSPLRHVMMIIFPFDAKLDDGVLLLNKNYYNLKVEHKVDCTV